MDEPEEDNAFSNGKITVASPGVLAAILDEGSDSDGGRFLQANGKPTNTTSDLDISLRDSLESSDGENVGELSGSADETSNRRGKEVLSIQLETSSPTRTVKRPNNAMKANKPLRSQHIVERNKENIGKRVPGRSYAQMHAMKAKAKLESKVGTLKNTEKELQESRVESAIENRTENTQQQHNYMHNSKGFNEELGRIEGANSRVSQQRMAYLSNFGIEGDKNFTAKGDDNFLENSNLDSSFHSYNYGMDNALSGDVNKTLNATNYYCGFQSTTMQQLPETFQMQSYETRGYYSAVPNRTQPYTTTKGAASLYQSQLSTQSAPPDMYGNRRPLVMYTGGSHASSDSPNGYYGSPTERAKIPELTLTRKFSSEPYLVQSNSPTMQKTFKTGRNSKGSGSYSSLCQPFEYKPYTLEDYRNFTRTKMEQLAGGLGPDIDSDDFKEKKEKVNKQREYASMLRAQHASMKRQLLGKEPRPPTKPPKLKEAEIKRRMALNYAKNVPKPKQIAGTKQDRNSASKSSKDRIRDDEQDITVLELLRIRHEKEKQEVDAMRKQLANKLRL